MIYDIKDFLKKFFSSRLFVLAAVIIFMFALLAERVFTLQIIKGADYQKKTTGAPDNTEYVVKTDKMPSGEKKFDGYNKKLQDSTDWDKWPPKGSGDWAKKRRQEMLNSAKKDADIAKQAGSKLEWHVPTKAKADELRKMFVKEGIDIDVVIVPK